MLRQPAPILAAIYAATLSVVLSGCAPWTDLAALRPSCSNGRVVGQLAPAPAHGEAITSGGTDAPVVVQLLALGASARRRSATSPALTLRDGRLAPEVAVVQPGEPIHFDNRDRVHHELFTADDEGALRVPLEPDRRSDPVIIESEGFRRVYCRLHPNERFALGVRRNTRLLRIEPGEQFEFAGLCPGRYELRATSTHGETESKTIELTRGRTVSIVLALEAANR